MNKELNSELELLISSYHVYQEEIKRIKSLLGNLPINSNTDKTAKITEIASLLCAALSENLAQLDGLVSTARREINKQILS